jgi:hypothetical protein
MFGSELSFLLDNRSLVKSLFGGWPYLSAFFSREILHPALTHLPLI